MIRSRSTASKLWRMAAMGAAMIGLCGCISLFPKTAPAQLYRFGDVAPAPAAAQAAPSRQVVALGQIAFDSAASSDRILTMTGHDAAYIAEARWVSPAPTLFEQAAVRAFEQTPGAPRLVGRGRSPLVLGLDVQSFEARYDDGPAAAPAVVVQVHAQLARTDGPDLVSERTFLARVSASDNRVSAIVDAYDQAVRQVLKEIIDWTTASAAAQPPSA